MRWIDEWLDVCISAKIDELETELAKAEAMAIVLYAYKPKTFAEAKKIAEAQGRAAELACKLEQERRFLWPPKPEKGMND